MVRWWQSMLREHEVWMLVKLEEPWLIVEARPGGMEAAREWWGG